jgi:hypothetical protein
MYWELGVSDWPFGEMKNGEQKTENGELKIEN